MQHRCGETVYNPVLTKRVARGVWGAKAGVQRGRPGAGRGLGGSGRGRSCSAGPGLLGSVAGLLGGSRLGRRMREAAGALILALGRLRRAQNACTCM
jgi:hypothetical protein